MVVGWAKAAEVLRLLHRSRSAVPTRSQYAAHADRVGTARAAGVFSTQCATRLCPPYETAPFRISSRAARTALMMFW
jgi:hypothetical protein